jgi:hypothetical protein
MRSLQTVLFALATILPAAMFGCSSDSGGGGGSGGSSGTGGRGGSGGSTGGTTGGSAGGTTGGSAGGSTGGTGTGGSTGGTGTGGSTGGTGTGGSTGGTGTGGSTGADGGAAVACGAGKSTPMGAVIDNFDGMKQVLEWRVANDGNNAGTVVMPTGSLEVTVAGPNTLALGALASWAAFNRPCMDASNYQGIQFKVSGTVTNLELRVPTPATYPLADGGVCTDATKCSYAHYRKIVPQATVTAGGMVQVPFSELMPPWGAPPPFDKSAVIAVVFLTTDADMTHKFTIDDIAFY